MRALFRYPSARRYLVGQSVSLFGDMTLWLAMGIWVKSLTGSNGAAGLTFFFFALPQLGAPLAGMLVDRFPRRTVMIWANLATGALVLALLAVHGRGQVWIIYLVMFGYGASGVVLGSGSAALLRLLLPEELLADANGYLRTVQEGLRLIGPITGATLFTVIGGRPLALIDAGTFVVAAAALWTVHVDDLLAARTGAPWHRTVLAGFEHIWRTLELRQIVVALAAALAVVGMIESAAFAVVGQGLHRPPSFLGVLIAVQGVGAIVAGLTAGPVTRRLGEGATVGAGLLIFAAGAALAAVPDLGVVFAGMVALGFSLPWVVVGANTALQLRTPLELQGRVSSASTLLVGVPQTISIAIGAAVVSVLPYQAVLALIGAVVAGCALYLLTRPAQRGSTTASGQGAPTEPVAPSRVVESE